MAEKPARKRGLNGRYLKEGVEEPIDSVLLPPGPTVVVEPDYVSDLRQVTLSPGQLQTALQAEVAEVVNQPIDAPGPGPRDTSLSATYNWPLYEQKYFRAVQEVIAERGWPTTAMIALRMGVTEGALQRWRHRNPEVDGKVSRALELQVDELWGRVLHRAFVLAVRGSIDHMTFLAKVTRRLGPETEGPGGVNVQVNIRV